MRRAGIELRNRWCYDLAYPERMELNECKNAPATDGGVVGTTDGGVVGTTGDGGILTLPTPVNPADTAPLAPSP